MSLLEIKLRSAPRVSGKVVTVAQGDKGDDGFSPVVEIAEIEGGHRVTVTDANGSQSFDVMNGKDGEGGGNVDIDLAADEEVLLLLMDEGALNVPKDSDGTIIADKNGVVLMN